MHELAAFMARDRDKYERELVLSRKRLEELVREANEIHADAKDRALFAEQMIGIVSHDLRNPEIARAHGGSAFVESTAEGGTTFTGVFSRTQLS